MECPNCIQYERELDRLQAKLDNIQYEERLIQEQPTYNDEYQQELWPDDDS